MKMKYQLTVTEKFFNMWQKEYEEWKTNTAHHKDNKFIINLIDEFFKKAEINKMIVSKYNDFEEEVYIRYITYVKNQIFKILPLAEEKGEWRKHLDTLINELTGSDKIFLRTVNFVSLINKLETLKDFPEFPVSCSLDDIKNTDEFKIFRKTVFECMNIAQDLSLVGDVNAN